MTPEQCRAGRAWLELSQDELAALANVSQSTVRDFEKGRRVPIQNNLEAIRSVMEKRGLQFPIRADGKPFGLVWTDSSGSAKKDDVQAGA